MNSAFGPTRIDVHHHLIPPAFVAAMQYAGITKVAGSFLPYLAWRLSLSNLMSPDMDNAPVREGEGFRSKLRRLAMRPILGIADRARSR